MMNKILFVFSFLLISNFSFAFDMPIEITHSGDDAIGKRIVYFLKENIQKSSSMHLTDKKELRMQVSIVTLDQNKSAQGMSSTYSVTWLWNNTESPWPYYLTSSVGYCGSDMVKVCAESLTANTYEQSEQMVKLISLIIENQNKGNPKKTD